MPETTRIAAALSDRYVIEREIGAGGMATVYLAHDRKHDRDVALKILRADLSAVLGGERFLNEVRITARLDHPHILTLIDSGEADGIYYYVLPYVRGESLRSKLEREKQLGLDEALSITRQIASALDYAHGQGVVHRDIKPENILLHEGEAMLADFGIALAVKEAGGNRLTETGLSLGTPQYMSPEQATGDRTLDARSDVYSLAAVLYEMLAGEAPVTGATAQAMIAKLMTERPTRLRVIRDTVPEGVDVAVAKALAKVPADRFISAGAFHQALAASTRAAGPAPDRRTALLAWGAAAVAAVALVLLFVLPSLRRAHPELRAAAVLRERTQLTFSGAVQSPAISPDGKQLAYINRDCSGASCTYAVVAQDVGGTATRSILDGASAGYEVTWSPDRRNLIFAGTIRGRYGRYLISTLGGPPRYLGTGAAAFLAGGDSLYVGPEIKPDTVFWVKVTALDGNTHDSVRVVARGEGLVGAAAVPGSDLLVADVIQGARSLWLVVDRHGSELARFQNDCTCPGAVDGTALWLKSGTNGRRPVLIRKPLDPATGRLSDGADTLYSGTFGAFSVTADGNAIVIGEGTAEQSVWAVDLADAVRGRFPETRRLARSSTALNGSVSPDGSRLLLRRLIPQAAGRSETRLAVMPFAGGQETALSGLGDVQSAFWSDSVSVAYSARVPGGLRFGLVDIRDFARRGAIDIADSAVIDFQALPGGWIWIPMDGQRVLVRSGDRTREAHAPAWYNFLTGVDVSRDGRRFAIIGWNKSTFDTVGVDVGSIDDLTLTHWFGAFGENGYVHFLGDGSLLLALWSSQESVTLFHGRTAMHPELLGSIPRPVGAISTSADLRRAAVVVRDYHGDAWMSRVTHP